MPRSESSTLVWRAVRRKVTSWLRPTIGSSQDDAAVHYFLDFFGNKLGENGLGSIYFFHGEQKFELLNF